MSGQTTAARYSQLLRVGGLALGDFHCPGHGPDCDRPEHAVSDEIIFVRRGLFGRSAGLDRVVADANRIMLMVHGEPFRIDHPLAGGDQCTLVSLGPRFWDEVGGRRRFVRARERGGCVDADAGLYWRQWCLLQQAHGGDELAVAEGLHRLAETALVALGPGPALLAAPRAMTERRHRRLVANVVELLNAEYSRAVTLPDIARRVHCSMFYLCRIFRDRTGSSIHAYLTRLRLRLALVRLAAGERDLAGLALDCGFSSASHFSQAFRRSYGFAPSRARLALSGSSTKSARI